jgi:hypothetical protein
LGERHDFSALDPVVLGARGFMARTPEAIRPGSHDGTTKVWDAGGSQQYR